MEGESSFSDYLNDLADELEITIQEKIEEAISAENISKIALGYGMSLLQKQLGVSGLVELVGIITAKGKKNANPASLTAQDLDAIKDIVQAEFNQHELRVLYGTINKVHRDFDLYLRKEVAEEGSGKELMPNLLQDSSTYVSLPVFYNSNVSYKVARSFMMAVNTRLQILQRNNDPNPFTELQGPIKRVEGWIKDFHFDIDHYRIRQINNGPWELHSRKEGRVGRYDNQQAAVLGLRTTVERNFENKFIRYFGENFLGILSIWYRQANVEPGICIPTKNLKTCRLITNYEKAKTFAMISSAWSTASGVSAEPVRKQFEYALEKDVRKLDKETLDLLDKINEKISSESYVKAIGTTMFCESFGNLRQAWLRVRSTPEENFANMVAYCTGRLEGGDHSQVLQEYQEILKETRREISAAAKSVPTGFRSLRLQRNSRHLQGHEVNGEMTKEILLYDHGSNPPSHAIWKIEPVGNGYYTLRLQRDSRHLQGHEVNGEMTKKILLYDHGNNPPSHAIWKIE